MLAIAMNQLQYLKNLLAREEGQDLVEYALLLGFIAIVAVVGITAAGEAISTMWDNLATAVGEIPVSFSE